MKKIISIIASPVLSVLFAVVLSVVLIYFEAVPVYADMGPKPSIELHIENPPEGEYYVDLLCDTNCGSCCFDEEYCAEHGLNYEMVEVLKNFEYDGLKPRFGGYISADNTINTPAESYDFTYMVPSSFRIIVVTEDLQTIVSPVVEPYSYNSVITFDMAKMGTDKEKKAVQENNGGTILRTLVIFLVTFGLTLLIERIVFACSKVSLKPKGNSTAFIAVNFGTQIMLYLGLFVLYYFEIEYFISLLILELIIIITEVLLLRRYLKEVDKNKIEAVIVSANIVSALLSVPVWAVIAFAHLLN